MGILPRRASAPEQHLPTLSPGDGSSDVLREVELECRDLYRGGLAYARRFLDADVADDAVQEAVLRYARQRLAADRPPIRTPWGLFLCILKSRIVKHRARARRRMERFVDIDSEVAYQVAAPGQDGTDGDDVDERKAREAMEAVSTLKGKTRAILQAKIDQAKIDNDVNGRELAALLDISEGAARVLLSRARKKAWEEFARRMSKSGDAPEQSGGKST